MRNLAALGLVCLAACAQSPVDVRETGKKIDNLSAAAPLDAAHCVVSNAEKMTFGMALKASVSLRPARQTNAYEVTVSGDTGFHGAIAFIAVQPHPKGSEITVWRSTSAMLIGVDQLDTVANGC